jgi:hypothetical protein
LADVQPRAREQNAFLKTHSWEEYAAWHLGLTEGAAERAKARYAFVYGDFRRLHWMGLIACHYRAAEWRHKRSSLQHTSSCSTSTERAPHDAAAPRAAAPLGEASGFVAKPGSTGSAPVNVHGGRWWTLRGRQKVRAPPAETTQLSG